MQENTDLIRSAVQEFCQRRISSSATEIERKGIGTDLVKDLGAQGFLGALIPQESGGSGLDRESFLVMLNIISSYSPSVAAKLLITNSILYQAVSKTRRDNLSGIVDGTVSGTVNPDGIFSGNGVDQSLTVSGNRISGVIKNLMSPDASIIVTDIGKGDLAAIYSGTEVQRVQKPLAFRGLRSGDVEVDTTDFHIIHEWRKEIYHTTAETIDLGVSSIALGISRGALNKVKEYVLVRKTFDHSLKDYSPVASQITGLLSELSIMEYYLENMEEMDDSNALMIKLRSTEFAKRATKAAIQYHGGYGYFEDFGIEKFYRDSYGLSAMFMDRHGDNMRLSEKVFGGKSGYL